MVKKPNFFIVGAPKCGTTAMTEYLKQHPDVFMPKYKAAFTFGSDLRFIHNISHPPDKCRVPIDVFLSRYEEATTEKRLGDASIFYLYSKRAAYELRDFNPDAQIIILLRNPVDLMVSLHAHNLFDLNEDIEDFEAALNAEKERLKGCQIPKTAYLPGALCYRAVATLTEQVRRYFDVFGRDNVHIVIFDDFKNDTALIYRKTLEFLEVDADFQARFEVVNPMKQVRSKGLLRFIVSPPRVMMPLAKRLSRVEWLRNLVYGSLVRFNTVERRRPPMAPALRRQLQEEFRPEVERLSDLLGRDLTDWTRT